MRNTKSDSSSNPLFPLGRLALPSLAEFMPRDPQLQGITLQRLLVATAIVALTLGLMRLIPNLGIAAAVIPLWCSAAGALVGGYHGATRGFIVAIVYPIYFSVLIAIAAMIFWGYALLHRAIAGDQILW